MKVLNRIIQYVFYAALLVFVLSAVTGIVSFIYSKATGHAIGFIDWDMGTICFWSLVACFVFAFISNQIDKLINKS